MKLPIVENHTLSDELRGAKGLRSAKVGASDGPPWGMLRLLTGLCRQIRRSTQGRGMPRLYPSSRATPVEEGKRGYACLLFLFRSINYSFVQQGRRPEVALGTRASRRTR